MLSGNPEPINRPYIPPFYPVTVGKIELTVKPIEILFTEVTSINPTEAI
jgi:hypothetical protein